MRLSDLQSKDIVTKDGKNIGKIVDIELNNQGQIVCLIVEPIKFFRNLRVSLKETTVLFNKIEKIGEDVILVNI